jgi:hypothetical protein
MLIEDDGTKATGKDAAPGGARTGGAFVEAGDGYVAWIGGDEAGAPSLDVRLFTPP